VVLVFPGTDGNARHSPAITKDERDLSRYLSFVCNFVFIFEFMWKVATYGWKGYIRNKWNRLDFFLVVVSVRYMLCLSLLHDLCAPFQCLLSLTQLCFQKNQIIDMIGDVIRTIVGDKMDKNHPAFQVLGFLKNFRALRALRPLRILSRAKGLKLVLATLARAVGPVLNTVAIALTVFFVAGIMSVQILGGRMMYCSDIHVHSQFDCVGVDNHTGQERLWLPRQLQYSWIGSAMLSMFVLASQDNWEMHMYAGIDATSKGLGPIANNRPETGVFYIAILVIASFFVMQLFVGVFIDTFQTVTSESKALQKKQSLSSENSSATSGAGNEEPASRLRWPTYVVVTTKIFDLGIAVFIVGNIIIMSAETVTQGVTHIYILNLCDFIFNFVFGAEVLAKQWGLYPQQYFSSRWNKFDFAVVMVSFFGVAIENLDSSITGALDPMVLRTLRTIRVFRILRAFRIFKAAEGLQNLVRTLLRSLTSVGNLAALLLLLFFVVGVLTVELYAGIPMCDVPNYAYPPFCPCLRHVLWDTTTPLPVWTSLTTTH